MCQGCKNEMEVIESDPLHSEPFKFSNVFVDGPCDFWEGLESNYILGENLKANFWFVIRFASRAIISKVQLRNTRNQIFNDRYIYQVYKTAEILYKWET